MYLGSTCCLKGMVGNLVPLHQQLGGWGERGVCEGGEDGQEHLGTLKEREQ